MIGLDTNILVHAHRTESPFNDAAYSRLKVLAESATPWAIPWPCLHEFLSVVTNPRIFTRPTPLPAALDQLRAWMESPSLVLLGETPEYWPVFEETVRKSKVVGARVHDARVYALCRVHGVSELLSADRDFTRFHGLKVRNPLAEVG